MSVNLISIYLLKVNNRNTSSRCEICSELTITLSKNMPAGNSCIILALLFSCLAAKTVISRSKHWRCSTKETVVKNLATFTGKPLCWSLFLIKFQTCVCMQLFSQRREPNQHWCFPVNVATFLRTTILKNIWGRLLLLIQLIHILMQRHLDFCNYAFRLLPLSSFNISNPSRDEIVMPSLFYSICSACQ